MKGIRPGTKVLVSNQDENTASIKTEPQSWVERTSGMMTEAWKDIDPIQELEKMKDEWDKRLKEQEELWNETKKL